MVSTNPVRITKEGLEKLQSELAFLKSVRRVEIAENLHESLSGGDNLDNTEYQIVLYEQLLLETRITYLEQVINNTYLIDTGSNGDIVGVGSQVVLQDEGEQLETYLIVGPVEADPTNGRISYECPMGRAILNRRSGDVIEVDTPDGYERYRIIGVS